LLALDRPRAAFDDFAQAAKVFHADSVHDRLKPHKGGANSHEPCRLVRMRLTPSPDTDGAALPQLLRI
jgi:hypothetical protein